MNIKELHTQKRMVSVASLFKMQQASVTAIQILEGKQLKKHTEKPALLLCVEGEVVFENEEGTKRMLSSGDYVNIEPKVEYWLDGMSDSQLLFMC